MSDAKIIQGFIRQLKKELKSLPSSEKEDIIQEIESHIEQTLDRNPDMSVLEVINSLGDPQKIALQYLPQKTDRLLKNKWVLYIAIIITALLLMVIFYNMNFLRNNFCKIGNEQGVRCKAPKICSTTEVIKGCCLSRQCIFEREKDLEESEESTVNFEGNKCFVNPGNETGEKCSSIEKCSSNEFYRGCCILGKCLD